MPFSRKSFQLFPTFFCSYFPGGSGSHYKSLTPRKNSQLFPTNFEEFFRAEEPKLHKDGKMHHKSYCVTRLKPFNCKYSSFGYDANTWIFPWTPLQSWSPIWVKLKFLGKSIKSPTRFRRLINRIDANLGKYLKIKDSTIEQFWSCTPKKIDVLARE